MRQQILIHLGKNMKCQGKEHGIAQQLRPGSPRRSKTNVARTTHSRFTSLRVMVMQQEPAYPERRGNGPSPVLLTHPATALCPVHNNAPLSI